MNASDIQRVTQWWQSQWIDQPCLTVFDMTLLAGGAIQENWLVNTDQGEFVLRTDAESGVSVSASRETEFNMLVAMHAAGVQVPKPILLCQDTTVIGKPFFIMCRVAGSTHPVHLTSGSALNDEQKSQLVTTLGQQLARIHGVSSDATVGLPIPQINHPAMPSRIAQYRQLLAELEVRRPVLEWAFRWLLHQTVPSTRTTLCHADYRTGNLMIESSTLTGILDWEFCCVSDPLEDIGWFTAPCWRFGRPDLAAGGLGEREDFYRGYELESGISIERSRVPYWEVLAIARWAVIGSWNGIYWYILQRWMRR